ncbi:MAG TPA: hypothetical protein VIO32_04080 [Candidatus Baltobacteraceae bacterium]
MTTRIRRINPVQFALVSATLYAIIVFIIALLWLPFASMMGALGAMGAGMGGRFFGAGIGIAVVIIWPVIYFVISFVFGLIAAALYNVVAGWTGGIEVTLEQTAYAGAGTA